MTHRSDLAAHLVTDLPANVANRICVNPSTECWNWTAATDRAGYGRIGKDSKVEYVHRVVYELLVRVIPDGLEIDHLCRNRACCNPNHLEAVTHRENMRRGETGKATGAKNRAKTHCPQGHEYADHNLIESTDKDGVKRRHCRTCGIAAVRRYQAKGNSK